MNVEDLFMAQVILNTRLNASMVYGSSSFQSYVCFFFLNKVHKTEMEMPKRGGDGWPQGKLNIDSIRAKMTLKDATRGGLLKVC